MYVPGLHGRQTPSKSSYPGSQRHFDFVQVFGGYDPVLDLIFAEILLEPQNRQLEPSVDARAENAGIQLSTPDPDSHMAGPT